MRWASAVVLLLVGAAAAAGCGGGGDGADRSRPAATATVPHGDRAGRPVPRIARVHCPAGAPAGCRSAVGRVLYVEAVDPDGDGDAHFVLASADSISAPGITAIDVERYLRPRRLPRVGDLVAAAGPVYRGSYRQRQIQAVRLRIVRVRR